jgi:hypothetical protein
MGSRPYPADCPERSVFSMTFSKMCSHSTSCSPIMTTLPASIILVWADENPHGILQLRHQHQFQINVLAGVVGDWLIGPCFAKKTHKSSIP